MPDPENPIEQGGAIAHFEDDVLAARELAPRVLRDHFSRNDLGHGAHDATGENRQDALVNLVAYGKAAKVIVRSERDVRVLLRGPVERPRFELAQS
jgi:hypothetical protein